MDKTQEALKLALNCVSTLANARDWVGCTPNERWDEDEMYAELCNATICLKKSLSIIQEALAEQPAQEPVAWINTTGDFLFQHPEEHGRENEEWFPLVHQNTSPPANTNAGKPWVGLTDEEVDECYYWKGRQWTTDELVRHVEAKLREKNNG